MSVARLLAAIAAASCLAFALITPANAGTVIVDVSAGSNWRTTTDVLVANQWNNGNFSDTDGVAATAPYGNVATTTLNEERMMWNCGADGMTDCTFDNMGNALGTGPDQAWFGLSFEVKDGAAVTDGAIGIIADDFFEFRINGAVVLEAFLSDNQDINGQPVPLMLDFATLSPFFQTGTNVLVVEAQDLIDPFEYLFISGSVAVVPEPQTLLLFGLGGLLLGRLRFCRAPGGARVSFEA